MAGTNGGLYSFTPATGPRKGSVYIFPNQVAPYAVAGAFKDQAKDLTMMDGKWEPMGTERNFFDAAQIDVQFKFTPFFLKDRYGGSSVQNREAAFIDMGEYLHLGGEGTLIVHPPPGTTHPRTHISLTQYSAPARLISGWRTERQVQGMIEMTWEIPGGIWILPDNSYIPVT